jgi:hypothetical protein
MRHLVFAISCIAASCSAASAATLIVGPGGVSGPRCPSPKYASIQAAVTAASPGDTVFICPGIYAEQVVINKALIVTGPSSHPGSDFYDPDDVIIAPVISATTASLDSSLLIGPIISVQNAQNVTLVNLTIDGSNNGLTTCAPVLVGILLQNASGTVAYDTIRNVQLGAGLGGCQSGNGILVQSAAQSTSTVEIAGNSIHNYQKNGITANDAGTTATIQGNVVTGLGPSNIIAQIGIQLFEGTGALTGNMVTNNIYSLCAIPTANGCPFAAVDLLVYDANSVGVSGNSAGASNVSIYFQGNSGTIQQNIVFGAFPLDGIDLIGDGNQATSNNVFQSGESAVYIDGIANTVDSDIFNEAPIGLLIDTAASGTSTSPNQFYNIHTPVGSITKTFSPVLPYKP